MPAEDSPLPAEGVPTARSRRRDVSFEAYRESGSRRLRNRLVEQHLDLVEFYVGRYGRGRMDADDVRQQALLALIKAVERFDPEVGVTFKTFANRTIEGELKRLLRDRGWSVRPPRSLQELAVQARRMEPELTQQLGRVPRAAELAEHLDESTDRVLEALAAGQSYRAESLDAPVGEDGATTRGAGMGDADPALGRVELEMDVESLLDGLDERDRMVIHLRFVERRSQQEIADRLGVSQSYLSRVLRRALATLREQAEAAGIEAPIGDAESEPA